MASSFFNIRLFGTREGWARTSNLTKSAIVVLDDLKNFMFEGDQALTPAAIDLLTSRTMVVETPQEPAVNRWNLLRFDPTVEIRSKLANVPSLEAQP